MDGEPNCAHMFNSISSEAQKEANNISPEVTQSFQYTSNNNNCFPSVPRQRQSVNYSSNPEMRMDNNEYFSLFAALGQNILSSWLGTNSRVWLVAPCNDALTKLFYFLGFPKSFQPNPTFRRFQYAGRCDQTPPP